MSLKAEKEILLQDLARQGNSNQTSPETIIKYEQQIAELRKQIEVLETSSNANSEDNAAFEMNVYRRFNKRLKERF